MWHVGGRRSVPWGSIGDAEDRDWDQQQPGWIRREELQERREGLSVVGVGE